MKATAQFEGVGLPAGRIDADALAARIRAARQALRQCEACEIRCGANRLGGERAPCRLGSATHCFRKYVSLTEEAELVPALRVYLAGCNFRCRFCNTAPECFKPEHVERVSPAVFAAELEAAVAAGVRTINLLGGEPSLHVHTILEIAAAAGRPLPLVLNTNAFMTPHVIDWLAGAIDVYLADFKFGNDDCAKRLAGIARYLEVVTRNLKALSSTATLFVRHLLIPGHLECCFRPVVDWLSDNLPGVRFQLMTGYVPWWRAESECDLGRLNPRGAIREAVEYLEGRNLKWALDGAGVKA